jgi:hypothetical protein
MSMVAAGNIVAGGVIVCPAASLKSYCNLRVTVVSKYRILHYLAPATRQYVAQFSTTKRFKAQNAT